MRDSSGAPLTGSVGVVMKLTKAQVQLLMKLQGAGWTQLMGNEHGSAKCIVFSGLIEYDGRSARITELGLREIAQAPRPGKA